MRTYDVVSVAEPPAPRVEPPEPGAGPELWPVGIWDAAWVLAGLVLARVLLLFG